MKKSNRFLYNWSLVLEFHSFRWETCQLNVIQSIYILHCEYSVKAKFEVWVRTVFHLPFPMILPFPFALLGEYSQEWTFISSDSSLGELPWTAADFVNSFWMPSRQSLAWTTVPGIKYIFCRNFRLYGTRTWDQSLHLTQFFSNLISYTVTYWLSFISISGLLLKTCNSLGYVLRSQD